MDIINASSALATKRLFLNVMNAFIRHPLTKNNHFELAGFENKDGTNLDVSLRFFYLGSLVSGRVFRQKRSCTCRH
jgi:hypothetical protein